MLIKKTLKYILILFLVILFCRYNSFNEPIFIYLLYIIFYKDKFLILGYSSIMFLNFNTTFFLKNIILFLLFEIILIIMSNNKINTRGKYRTFLLTFLLYLVLINVFEPMVYNYNRLFKSINLYLINILVYKIYIMVSKYIKGSDCIE